MVSSCDYTFLTQPTFAVFYLSDSSANRVIYKEEFQPRFLWLWEAATGVQMMQHQWRCTEEHLPLSDQYCLAPLSFPFHTLSIQKLWIRDGRVCLPYLFNIHSCTCSPSISLISFWTSDPVCFCGNELKILITHIKWRTFFHVRHVQSLRYRLCVDQKSNMSHICKLLTLFCDF